MSRSIAPTESRRQQSLPHGRTSGVSLQGRDGELYISTSNTSAFVMNSPMNADADKIATGTLIHHVVPPQSITYSGTQLSNLLVEQTRTA